MLAQLSQIAQGLGVDPNQGVERLIGGNNLNNNVQLNRQSQNPAFGAPGVAQVRGMGNQPSPEAGFNTTASRNGNNGDDVAARMSALGLEMP